MNIVFQIGYRQAIIKNVDATMVDKLMSSIPSDAHFIDGKYQYFRSSDNIEIKVINSDSFHDESHSDYIAMKDEADLDGN